MISFLNPQILPMPQRTLLNKNFDKMLSTLYFLDKDLNELSNFASDLILYFGTVCLYWFLQPQVNSLTVSKKKEEKKTGAKATFVGNP